MAFPEFSDNDKKNYSLDSILGATGVNFIP